MHVISLRRMSVVVLGAFVVAMAAAAPAGAYPYRPYSVVLTAGVAANGSTVQARFVNESTREWLDSAELTAPSGYTLSSATVSQGRATVARNVVYLRDLALIPGQSLTVTIQMTSSTCSTSMWTVRAKGPNRYPARPNNFTLDSAHSNLNTGVCSAPCPANTTCNTDAGNANGSAQVAAGKSNTAGELFESANPSNLEPLTCQNPDGSDYASADPNTYGVFSTANRAKVVTITITNPLISIPLSEQQVCFDAPYQFATAPGAPLLPDGNGGYIGLLPNCGPDRDSPARLPGDVSGGTGTPAGPCHDRDDDSQTGSTVVLVVNIPSGLPGDPHMN